jgi:N-acetylglucosaminyldiphosphoundecaprenol N-acetyl-beta-D-mannosaminyltransferase
MATLVTKQQPPIAILGVPFDNVTTADAISSIDTMIASRSPHYVVTANVDFLVQARDDVELRRILFDAHLVLCDGTPLIWASRFLGNPLPERVAGADLVPLLIDVAAKRGYKLFLLGATPESAGTAAAVLKKKYPALELDFYSPPFKHLLEMDHQKITARIAAAKPDVLLVSFGCPKQEKWIQMHYRSLGVPVSIGVGATIDFLAGQVRRAPRWMQRSGLEWVFRLMQEPRRLFKRYVKDLSVFGIAIIAQWAGLGRRKRMRAPASHEVESLQAPEEAASVSYEVRKVHDRLDIESTFSMDAPETENPRHLVLDMSSVCFIDSTGIGVLIRLDKRLRGASRRLFLFDPTDTVKRALKLMHLHNYFDQVRTIEEALETIRNDDAHILQPKERPDITAKLRWTGEVTASTIDRVWAQTEDFLAGAESRALTITMSRVRFIDSSGLGIMLRARKEAQKLGVELQFTDFQPAVANVIRLSKLQHLFGVANAKDSHPPASRSGNGAGHVRPAKVIAVATFRA